MSEIEKFPLNSVDIKEEQIAKMKQLFPEVFTEGTKIDWDKLRLTLGENIDTGKERYGMNWPGKADCFKTIQQPSIATLVPDREESVNFDTTENLFIEGDNLEVLKLLQKSYIGKIKMIYIDPPYNTGNEFIYPDNYSESLNTYLEYTGQIDSEGRKFSTNAETDGRFHSKWMNMMYPRLFLAKNLLRNDGLLFISIDDSEAKNLRALCDEIFGEENFIAQFIWHSRQNVDSRSLNGASIDHEYTLCFSKSSDTRVKGKSIDKSKYTNPDEDARGPWMSSPMDGIATKDKRPNLHFTIVNPLTGLEYQPSPENGWRFQRSTVDQMIVENRIIWPKNPTSKPRFKRYLNELNNEFTGFSSLLDVDFTSQGTKELRNIMEMEALKFPKPVSLIKTLCLQGMDHGDLILDFFSGSSTTAQAVYELNIESNGSYKFICVQLPEPVDEASDAFKAGYNTIADIGKERIRRVIKKLFEADIEKTKQQKDAPNMFDTEKPEHHKRDLGFKVFKLQKSNFNIWNSDIEKTPEAIQDQLALHVEHISPEAAEEAILYELLLKSGFSLTTKVEKIELEGKQVFSVEDGALLICLEKKLTHQLIKAMAERKPVRVICLDEGFQNNDQLKANAVLIMKSNNVLKFQTV